MNAAVLFVAALTVTPTKAPATSALPDPPAVAATPTPPGAAPETTAAAAPSAALNDQPPPSAYDRLGGAASEGAPDGDLTGALLRTLLSLGAVVALIYVVFKLGFARFLSSGLARGGGRELKVVERIQLDTKNAVYVVDVKGGGRMVLGTGPEGVRLITRLDTTSPDGASSGGKFREMLSADAAIAADVIPPRA